MNDPLKMGDLVTVVDGGELRNAAVTAPGPSGASAFTVRTFMGGAGYDTPRLLIREGEGITWIRGHHQRDTEQGRALAAAYSLANT